MPTDVHRLTYLLVRSDRLLFGDILRHLYGRHIVVSVVHHLLSWLLHLADTPPRTMLLA